MSLQHKRSAWLFCHDAQCQNWARAVAVKFNFVRHMLVQGWISSASSLHWLSCITNALKMQPRFIPSHPCTVLCSLCREGSSSERNSKRTAEIVMVWLAEVSSHLQEVTKHVTKDRKDQGRQLVTPPASIEECLQPSFRGGHVHITHCSWLSQLPWDCSPATSTPLAPCSELTLHSWKT